MGVKPNTLGVKHLNLQLTFFKESLVDISNLQTPSFGKVETTYVLDDTIREHIKAGDGEIVRFVACADNILHLTFFVHKNLSILIEVSLILHKDGCIATLLDSTYCLLDSLNAIIAINDHVACYQTNHRLIINR